MEGRNSEDVDEQLNELKSINHTLDKRMDKVESCLNRLEIKHTQLAKLIKTMYQNQLIQQNLNTQNLQLSNIQQLMHNKSVSNPLSRNTMIENNDYKNSKIRKHKKKHKKNKNKNKNNKYSNSDTIQKMKIFIPKEPKFSFDEAIEEK